MKTFSDFGRGALCGGTALWALALVGVSPATAQSMTAPIAQPANESPQGSQQEPAVVPAQDSNTAAAGSSATASDIIVTGSRITAPNLQSASPITTLSQDDIRVSGNTRVEDLVNKLPQVFVSQASGVSNGASGIATLNLRNLGTDRTLVLVNGHRLPPGDPSGGGSAADVNNIPAFLVKRVDVLTGGASATYGADAVAGVVNFILDDTFTGVRLDAQGSVYQHNNNNKFVQGIIAGDPRYTSTTNPIAYPSGNSANGGNYDLSAAFGGKLGDQGHITAFLSYHHQDPVLQATRDYSACGLANGVYENGTSPPASRALDFSCSGSSNTAQANFLPNSGAGSRIIVTPGSSGLTGTAGTRAYSAARDAYNFNPTNYFIRPDERINAGFSASYDVSSAIRPYMSFMFMDDHSIAQIAPSGTFNNVFTINCSNPLATAAQLTSLGCTAPGAGSTQTVAAAIAKRNVEGGGRQDDLRHTAYLAYAGVRGDLGSGFSYDVYGQYGATNYSENYKRDFSRSRVQNAINGCVTATGAAISDQACVPYNIFTGTTALQSTTAAGVTQGALDYIQTPGFKSGQTQEYVVSAVINADLGQIGFTSPLATDGIHLAFGPEYRKEQLTLNTDVEYATGDLLGQGGQTKSTAGSYDVVEGFVEALVPLAQDKPLFQSLTVDGAYRHSQYSTVGGTNTYKVEATWAPFNGNLEGLIKFRGSINRAVRAPTVQDFFQPSQLGLGGSTDPCATRSGGRAASTSLATCLRSAQSDPNFAAHYGNGTGIARNPASQYNSITAGATTQGSALQAETADTKTAGVLLQPRGFLRGFSLSADYYDIHIKNRIGRDGYNLILSQCLGTGSAYYCGLIHRDPANGSLWLTPNGYINDPIYNAGEFKTKGVDFAASYTRPFFGEGGRLGISFQGTLLLSNQTQVTVHNSDGSIASNGFYDCKGYYGDNCGVPNPTWRHRMVVTASPNDRLSASFGWRYIGATYLDAANQDLGVDGNPLIGAGQPKSDFIFSRIAPYSYFDLTLSFSPTPAYTLRMGVNNLLDKDPAIIPGADLGAGNNNGNTYPGYYDQLGRQFFVAASLKF